MKCLKGQFENRERTMFFNECGQKAIHFLALLDSIAKNVKQESFSYNHYYVYKGAK